MLWWACWDRVRQWLGWGEGGGSCFLVLSVCVPCALFHVSFDFGSRSLAQSRASSSSRTSRRWRREPTTRPTAWRLAWSPMTSTRPWPWPTPSRLAASGGWSHVTRGSQSLTALAWSTLTLPRTIFEAVDAGKFIGRCRLFLCWKKKSMSVYFLGGLYICLLVYFYLFLIFILVECQLADQSHVQFAQHSKLPFLIRILYTWTFFLLSNILNILN